MAPQPGPGHPGGRPGTDAGLLQPALRRFGQRSSAGGTGELGAGPRPGVVPGGRWALGAAGAAFRAGNPAFGGRQLEHQEQNPPLLRPDAGAGLGPGAGFPLPRLPALLPGLGAGTCAGLPADRHLGGQAAPVRRHQIHPLHRHRLPADPAQRPGPGLLRRQLQLQPHGALNPLPWRQFWPALLSRFPGGLWRQAAHVPPAHLAGRCPR